MEALLFIHRDCLGFPVLKAATWLPGKHNAKTDEKKAGEDEMGVQMKG